MIVKSLVICDQLNLQAIPFKFRGTMMKFPNDIALSMSPIVKRNTTVPLLGFALPFYFCDYLLFEAV